MLRFQDGGIGICSYRRLFLLSSREKASREFELDRSVAKAMRVPNLALVPVLIFLVRRFTSKSKEMAKGYLEPLIVPLIDEIGCSVIGSK